MIITVQALAQRAGGLTPAMGRAAVSLRSRESGGRGQEDEGEDEQELGGHVEGDWLPVELAEAE